MYHNFMRGMVTALGVVFLTSTLTLAADSAKPAETPKAAPGVAQSTPATPTTPQSKPAAPKAAETPKAAPSQTISGTIANLDMTQGMVTLTTADNQTRQLTVAKRSLLEGLKVGDRVKVDMVGKDVQAIQRDTRG
jgi:hypothetical protein